MRTKEELQSPEFADDLTKLSALLTKKEEALMDIVAKEWIDNALNKGGIDKEKATKGLLSAKEVFEIKNTEQRRIAYELMDKAKMKELGDYKVLDERKKDEQGNSDKVIEFKIDGFDEPFRYYNCICPTTMREYHIQTKQDTCIKAKNSSFGLDDVVWTKEY